MKRIIAGYIMATLTFSACKEKVDPVDTNNATITLMDKGAGYVTENITVNPKDSLFFSYTVTSDRAMKYVGIQKNPVNQVGFVTRDTISDASKFSYTTEKRLRADSINGTFLYRISAHDAIGTYIGHKDVIVTVRPDFDHYTLRILRVPDTVAKTNPAYLSASTGTTYSYTTGAANSASIDFGLYYDTTGTASTSATDDLRFSLYSLSAAQPQLSFYDIGSWTKNITIMKKVTSASFNNFTSAAALRATAISNLASGATNKVTQLVGNNVVYFKTSTGKYGAMLINFVSGSSPAKESYINVDIKIEK